MPYPPVLRNHMALKADQERLDWWSKSGPL